MKYIGIVVWVGIITAVFLEQSFFFAYAQEQPQIQVPSEEKAEFALADQPLEIWTFINDYRIITGKTLYLTVQVMWKLGVTVDLEGIDRVNLSPFVIEDVLLCRHKGRHRRWIILQQP